MALYSHKACIVHDERKRETFKESVGEREMKGDRKSEIEVGCGGSN